MTSLCVGTTAVNDGYVTLFLFVAPDVLKGAQLAVVGLGVLATASCVHEQQASCAACRVLVV